MRASSQQQPNGNRNQRRDQSRINNEAIKNLRTDWVSALRLLNDHETDGTASVHTYAAVIRVCGRAKQWKVALQLLKRMEQRKMYPEVVTFSAAISACGNAGQWR